jgi:hypothetical protein
VHIGWKREAMLAEGERKWGNNGGQSVGGNERTGGLREGRSREGEWGWSERGDGEESERPWFWEWEPKIQREWGGGSLSTTDEEKIGFLGFLFFLTLKFFSPFQIFSANGPKKIFSSLVSTFSTVFIDKTLLGFQTGPSTFLFLFFVFWIYFENRSYQRRFKRGKSITCLKDLWNLNSFETTWKC